MQWNKKLEQSKDKPQNEQDMTVLAEQWTLQWTHMLEIHGALNK